MQVAWRVQTPSSVECRWPGGFRLPHQLNAGGLEGSDPSVECRWSGGFRPPQLNAGGLEGSDPPHQLNAGGLEGSDPLS